MDKQEGITILFNALFVENLNNQDIIIGHNLQVKLFVFLGIQLVNIWLRVL